MYTILTTNAENIKSRGLESKTAAIDIAVLTSDIENGIINPIYYAYRYGCAYHPNEDFKPSIASNHKIKGQLVEDYWDMLEVAKTEYKKRLEAFKNSGSSYAVDELRAVNEELRNDNERKLDRIKNQSEFIQDLTNQLDELKAKQANSNNSHIDRMEDLVNLQAIALKQLQEMKPREIIVKIGDKTNSMKSTVLHEEFETVLELIANDEPVFLSGSAGTGKSKIAEQVAEALGLDFYPESAISQEYKLTGFLDMKNDFKETAFYKAFKYGGLFMIDEIDASHPDVLVIINTAIAQRYFTFHGEFVRAHENFRIIAAGNTVGTGADAQYTGRYQLDASTLDRFFIIEIKYDINIEMSITDNDSELVEFARKVREAAEIAGISILFSYRSLGRISKMQDKMDLVKLLKIALLKGIAADDVKILYRNMGIESSNKYFKALKKAA
jgi:adenosyl cobinamide kinase/adenosyl cobinamide phosphate guanylyltransferase